MPAILHHHFVLAVRDLRASADFFLALGFSVVAEPEGWVFVKRDDCMIMLGGCPGAMAPSALGDHSYFGYLRVDDVDAYYEELRARGVETRTPPETKPWNMREFAVVSPEGHRLTIGQWKGDPA